MRRLLTGELRQGALAGLMADAVAKAAGVPADARAARADALGRPAAHGRARADRGRGRRCAAVGFELFRPVLPMLASTGRERRRRGRRASSCASVEWKLDGIRIQVHRRGDEVRIYTRNLNEITARCPGSSTRCARCRSTQAVLDGEAIWMGDDGPGRVPGHDRAARRRRAARGRRTFFFDVLHLDGDDLLDAPLAERAARLDAIAPRAARSRGVLTADPDEGERVLDEALAAGHEGVMVKDAASLYDAGRRGKAWRKVKPVRTYDLVVLGAEWGHGRRQGWLSNLHLGARDPRRAAS